MVTFPNRTIASFLLILLGTMEISAGQDQEMMRQVQLARAYEDAGEWPRAREIYDRLYHQAPENTMVLDLFFECCLTLKSYEEALAAVDRRLLNHADDIHAGCLRGRALARSGRKAQAIQEWSRLFEIHPKEESVYRAVADAMVRENLLEEAVRTYEKGRKTIGSPDAFALEISFLYETSGNYGKAASELMDYYRSHPDRGDDVRVRFGRFPRNESVSNELFKCMKRMPEVQSGSGWLFRLFLQYAFLSNNDADAFRFTEDLEGRGETRKSGYPLFLLAEEASASGHFSEAEKAYREILRKYPDFPKKAELSLGIARCLQAQKNYREALYYYEETIGQNPDPVLTRQALLEKGRLSLAVLEDPNDAKNTYQILIKKFPLAPEHDQWMLELGQCELMLGNFSAAESDFQAVLESERRKSGGNWIPPTVLLAQNHYYQGRIDETMKDLDQLSLQNLNVKFYQDPLLNDALELKIFLREYGGRCRECVRLFAEAEFSQKQRRLKEAITVLDSISGMLGGNGFEAEVLYKKAEIVFQLTRYKESLEIIRQFLREYPAHPKTLQIMLLSAEANEKIGEYGEALDQYDRILREYPNTLAAEESRTRIQALQEKMKP
jgi:tetratricopeptide (TPR) repeat protein